MDRKKLIDSDYLDYWNKLYKKEFFFGTGPTKLAKLAEELFSRQKPTKILEIGCGQGRDAIHFSQLGYDVQAFDISENAINFLLKKKNELNLSNLTVFTHDVINELNFPKNYFDFIYSNLALQFFNIDNLGNILSNISKVTTENSYFLLSTKKEGDKYYKTGRKINDYAYENKGITRYFYPIETLQKTLSKEFKIISVDSDNHKNLDSTVSVWWKILLQK